MNTGNGALGTPVSYNTFPGGVGAVVADLNEDGYPDIVLWTGGTSGALGAMINKGNGTFLPPIYYATSSYYNTNFTNLLQNAAVGDLYHDGRFHVALASCYLYSSGVDTYRNPGNGQIAHQALVSTAGSWVTVADLNNDGYADLVIVPGDVCVGVASAPYTVLLNKGDGTFGAPVTSSVNASWVAAKDVNDDGFPDLILTGEATVSIALNQGNGTFAPPTIYTLPYNITGQTTIADLDDDSRPDLLIPTSGGVAVMRNMGAGTFQQQDLLTTANGNPTQISVVDLNGDGHPSVVVPDPTSGSTKILLYQNGTATACGFLISPSNILLSSPNAGNGSVAVTAGSGCGWTARASSDSNWVSITPNTAGTGNGTMSYSVGANTGAARIGTVSLAGQTVTFTQPAALATAPQLSITKAHEGNFGQGQTNGSYTVTVTNAAGAGPTTDIVTVTETLPSGLTLVSLNGGTTWNCTALPTCTTNTVLNPGSAYPPITVTVKVAPNAPAQLTNQVAVSGGGSVSSNASDITSISTFSCDVTGDGSVNVSDVQTIINQALGVVPATNDLNHDGIVNVSDVQKVINAALGLGCPY
jgi:uncharacterized repeat protein (TIGR01451 family)